MLAGLQAGFGASVAADLAGIAAHGFGLIRQDLFAETQDIEPLVQEFVGAPCLPLFLIGGGAITDVEAGNRLEPFELASMASEVVHTADLAGITT